MRVISTVQYLIGFTIYNPDHDEKKDQLRNELIELFQKYLSAESINQSLYKFSSSKLPAEVKEEVFNLCKSVENSVGIEFTKEDFLSLFYSGYLENHVYPKDFWDKIVECRIR